jgi:hypothetical protein
MGGLDALRVGRRKSCTPIYWHDWSYRLSLAITRLKNNQFSNLSLNLKALKFFGHILVSTDHPVLGSFR